MSDGPECQEKITTGGNFRCIVRGEHEHHHWISVGPDDTRARAIKAAREACRGTPGKNSDIERHIALTVDAVLALDLPRPYPPEEVAEAAVALRANIAERPDLSPLTTTVCDFILGPPPPPVPPLPKLSGEFTTALQKNVDTIEAFNKNPSEETLRAAMEANLEFQLLWAAEVIRG